MDGLLLQGSRTANCHLDPRADCSHGAGPRLKHICSHSTDLDPSTNAAMVQDIDPSTDTVMVQDLDPSTNAVMVQGLNPSTDCSCGWYRARFSHWLNSDSL